MPPLSYTQTPEPVSIHSRAGHSQVTPPRTEPGRAKKLKMEPAAVADLAPVFKTELTNLRSLVTCSICDQLLYEPFTIQCGHTYCYSCLCSWFVPNRKKKTCPECRTIIKQMPAPSFMIKQMVEIFVNRAELMPADESIEQHVTKRAEEVAAVDVDRNGPNGLFKGLFPPGRQELILDEADGVHRCPQCNAEYVGGPRCEGCGFVIAEDDVHNFSGEDIDEMSDMEEYEEGLRQELENEYGDRHGGAFGHMARMHHLHFHHAHHPNHPHHHGDESSSIESGEESRDDVGDEDESLSESEDDEGSLRDFVEHDESPVARHPRHATPPRYGNVAVEVTPHAEPPRRGQPIDISDDDSDEGGPVISRGRHNRWSRPVSTQPSVINLVEDDSSASEAGDGNGDSVAERLRYDGWSPLHESEADDNESDHRVPGSNDGTDDDSDTETINDGGSPRRRFTTEDFSRTRRHQVWSPVSDADDDVSEDDTNVDRDGDTEMSVSPDHIARRHPYDDYPESDVSHPDTDYGYNRGYDMNSMGADGIEELGDGHHLQELDDDTSDGWPSDTAPRRRPRQTLVQNQEQDEGYNPRISRIFASHQDIVLREGIQRNPASFEHGNAADRDIFDFQGLDFNHDHSVRQPANSSRTRRPARYYRMQESRSQSAQRRTQSPSVERIMSSSMRPSRAPPSYDDRSRGVSELRYRY